MTESFKQQLQELIDQAAEKFDERNNQETDYYCPYSFKQGCEFLMPVLMKAIEQRHDAYFENDKTYSQLESSFNKELLYILKGEGK